jgi:hypothetical protein
MTEHTLVRIAPVLDADGAAAIVDLCHRFGPYPMYSEERVVESGGSSLADVLPQRYDAAANFVRTGGRFGRAAPVGELAARTNYFRAEYAYGDRVLVDGIEPFLHHEALVEAARAVHGRPVVEPAIVYANILVPGQELAVHTDVPEFRGANRKTMPQWLLVAMHHSGLFADHRMPIATAVSWWSPLPDDGGEFACYPDGPDGAAVALPAAFDTAVVLDTDSVFHGVDRVAGGDVATLSAFRPGMTLEPGGRSGGDELGPRTWAVRAPEGDCREIARFEWDDLRFSISWKAYCFVDEHERRTWRDHADDLTLDVVIGRLVRDLRDRGRIPGEIPTDRDLALLVIDEYIRFPEPAPAPS